MVNSFLVPEKTVITAKGDGAAVDISGAQNRVYLLTLRISKIVEQESLDERGISKDALAADIEVVSRAAALKLIADADFTAAF